MPNIARLLRRLAPALVGSVLLLNAPALHAQELPALEFVDSAPLALAVAAGKPARQVVFIRNRAAQPVTLRFSALLYDDKNQPQALELQTEPAAPQIAGLAVQPFTLTLALAEPTTASASSAKGFLVVADAGASIALPGTRELTLNPAASAPFALALIIPLGIMLACILLAVCASWGGGRSPDKKMLGAAEWDITKSWASITTLGVAFFTTALSSLIPEATDKNVTATAVIFAAFVLAAPVFYNLWLDDGTPPKGVVGLYFLSSGVTLWGVFGALYLGSIVVGEIQWNQIVDDPLVEQLQYLPWVLIIVIAIYAVLTMIRTVRTHVEAAESDVAPASDSLQQRARISLL